LFLVHRPDWLTPAEETARGLRALLRSGAARAVGVSNYTPAQVDALQAYLGQPVAANQVEFSLFHMDPVYDGTFDQCQRDRSVPMAWSPLGGGQLFLAEDVAAGRVRAALEKIAPKYAHASVATLALAWCLAHPARPVVVCGTNKIDRLKEFAQATRTRLSREDWYALWEAAQGRRVP
jgi:predicted oxidoreductase